jgi:hypothetical protein
MKKIISLSSAASAALMLAPQAFAQTAGGNISPCAGATGIVDTLCKARDLGHVLGFVVTIAFIIAILTALLFLIWGGIKWITSGGDKAGVETARNQIIAAIIGLIVVFLAFFILNLILTLFGLSLFDLKLPSFPTS